VVLNGKSESDQPNHVSIWTDNLWFGGKNELFVTSSTGNCFITITYARQTATSSLFSLPFPAYPNPRYIVSPVGLWGAKHQTHFGALWAEIKKQWQSKGMYGNNGSLNRWPPMTSANFNSSLRTENSVFLAPESPFYLHFFGWRPKGGGHDPMVNTPVCYNYSDTQFFLRYSCTLMVLINRCFCVYRKMMFLSIWNRTNRCINVWGSVSSQNAPNGSIPIKRLKNIALCSWSAVCNLVVLLAARLCTEKGASDNVRISGKRKPSDFAFRCAERPPTMLPTTWQKKKYTLCTNH